MNTVKSFAFALLLLSTTSAVAATVELLQPPTGEQTSLSRLTTDAKGNLHLSWVKSSGKLSSLYYSSLSSLANDKWSSAKLISEGDDWFVNWADFPFLSVNDGGMAAHWLEKSSLGTYDYDIVATFYDKSTERWSQPAVIHQDGVSAEHGFVSMLPMDQGRTFISWLDGRNTKKNPSQSDPHSHSSSADHAMGGMTLRGGIFNNKGETLQEWELDDLVCDCCQTSSAMTAAGPVVVYRNRTTDEIRDTYITRMIDGRWTAPAAVHSDQWQVAGCPVNGPSIASEGRLTAVAWFTARDDKPKVSFVLSQNDGATFGDPVVVAESNTSGRVSVAILASGNIAVSWLEIDGAEAQIKLALYNQQGKLQESVTVANTKSSRRSGFPIITSQGNTVYVTWSDISGEPTVRVARLQF